VLFNKYYSGDQIKKNDMGVSGSTHGGTVEVHKWFRRVDLMERDNLKDLSIGVV